MNKRKTIGIVGFSSNETRTFGVPTTYLEWVSQFADPMIILPWETEIRTDALLLIGGQDVAPMSYGKYPEYKTGNPQIHQQYFHDTQLKKYIEAHIPIIGVCLGHQQIAAYFKVPLLQHLKYHKNSSDRWSPAHEITILGQKELKMKVNGHHHQCFLMDDLPEELIPLAVCKDSEENMVIVEVMKHRDFPILSFQYHVEEWYDSYSTKLVTNLLK